MVWWVLGRCQPLASLLVVWWSSGGLPTSGFFPLIWWVLWRGVPCTLYESQDSNPKPIQFHIPQKQTPQAPKQPISFPGLVVWIAGGLDCPAVWWVFFWEGFVSCFPVLGLLGSFGWFPMYQGFKAFNPPTKGYLTSGGLKAGLSHFRRITWGHFDQRNSGMPSNTENGRDCPIGHLHPNGCG